MKVEHLAFSVLLSAYCSVATAAESSNAICDKGIFPSTAPQKEGVIPLTEPDDTEEGNTTTQPSDKQDQNSQPQSDQNDNNMKKSCTGR